MSDMNVDMPHSPPQMPIDVDTSEQLAAPAQGITSERKDKVHQTEADQIEDTQKAMQSRGTALDADTYDALAAGEPALPEPTNVNSADLQPNEWFKPNLIAALTIAILEYVAETAQNKLELGLMMADWLLKQMGTAKDIADLIRSIGDLKSQQKMMEAFAAIGSIAVNGLGLGASVKMKTKNADEQQLRSNQIRMGTDVMQQSIGASKAFYESLVIEPGLAGLEAIKTMVEQMLKADEQTIQRIAEAINVDQDIIKKFLDDLVKWIDAQIRAHSLSPN